MTDMINPDHYKGDRKYEPIAVIEDWGLNYRLGNAVKYLSRNGRKPGEDPREGLRKAIWYIEREIAALDSPSPYALPADDQYDDVLRPSGAVRVYELAHELGASNREVLEACDSLGINVKAHSSSLCAAAASKLRGFLRDRGVQYEDVLDYYGQTQDLNEAWPEVPFMADEAGAEDWESFWNEVDSEHRLYVTDTSAFLERKEDVLWDPSLGPVELSEGEIFEIIGRKDLEQFGDDEIVSTVEKRGFILGVKKDGSTCVLKDGRCE